MEEQIKYKKECVDKLIKWLDCLSIKTYVNANDVFEYIVGHAINYSLPEDEIETIKVKNTKEIIS